METITAELAAQITAIGNVSLVASGATAPFVQAIAPAAGYGPLSRDQDHEISFDVSWIGTVPATYEDQVFNGSLDVVTDGEVVGGKTVKITVPLDEEIIMPRPDDVSGNWMLIHQVTGIYFIAQGYFPTVGLQTQIWNQDPPDLRAGAKGYLWVLEKQTDGTYLIKTWEKELGGSAELYLQAPAKPGYLAQTTLQKREQKETGLQSWVLVPVSSDPDTYAIQPKLFPDYALGSNGSCNNGAFVVASHTWGKPTFHHYWRLSQPPAGFQ
ncbi:hypothetical protein [Nostoc sp. NZL]|uniref:hypothetical protein n=1 Tax=Nostoc sp. NZL TaxID=2650612 RepID=UPI001E35E5C3|nr:hypothetical protein [Nostoc sp. NZL]